MTRTTDNPSAAHAPPYDVQALRQDFPILHQKVHGKPLVYLDNAATTQKPAYVLDAVQDYYTHHNANVHRGIHALSERATERYENARDTVQRFVNAPTRESIVFTSGATQGINLVAQTWAKANLAPGDEILITHMEHHSNIVPWQILCQQIGAILKVAPIDEHGQLAPNAIEQQLTSRTKLLAIVHMSNALGTINPLEQIIPKAHSVGAKVLVDGAQSASHLGVDVQALNCDFFVFSGHKIFGPTGIGALYARPELLEDMPPYQGGGDMIKSVTFAHTDYADPPYRFEAGTPNIAGAIGLAAALDYVRNLGLDNIADWEKQLLDYATDKLTRVPGLRLIGTAKRKAAILSFVLDYAHPLDAGMILDRQGIAVRTGHHCTQPVMDHFQIPATIRASLGPYNTFAEIDALAQALEKVREFA